MPLTVQSGWCFSFFTVFICWFVVLFSYLWNGTIWQWRATSSSSDLLEAICSLVTLFMTYHITVYCYRLTTLQCIVTDLPHYSILFLTYHITLYCYRLTTLQYIVSDLPHYSVLLPIYHITVYCYRLTTLQCIVTKNLHHDESLKSSIFVSTRMVFLLTEPSSLFLVFP
jgi:hypothetical protein